MDKADAITQLIQRLVIDGYTGKLEINFFRGAIGAIRKEEIIRLDDVVTQ